MLEAYSSEGIYKNSTITIEFAAETMLDQMN